MRFNGFQCQKSVTGSPGPTRPTTWWVPACARTDRLAGLHTWSGSLAAAAGIIGMVNRPAFSGDSVGWIWRWQVVQRQDQMVVGRTAEAFKSRRREQNLA